MNEYVKTVRVEMEFSGGPLDGHRERFGFHADGRPYRIRHPLKSMDDPFMVYRDTLRVKDNALLLEFVGWDRSNWREPVSIPPDPTPEEDDAPIGGPEVG